MNTSQARISLRHPGSVLAWARKRLRGFENVPVAYLEVSAVCNLDCRICFAPGTGEKLGLMDRKTFILVARHTFPYIYGVNFVGYGDPLINSDIAWMVRHVVSYGREAHLTTNGGRLDGEVARALVDGGLASIAFSLDGATAGTNDAIRDAGSFDAVIRAIRVLREARESTGSRTPHILIDTVLTRSNLEEVPAMVALAKELGARQLNLANLQCRSVEMEDEAAYSIRGRGLAGPLEEAKRRSEDLGISLKLPTGFSPGEPMPCHWDPSKMIAVTWEGKLRPCCFLFHDNAWTLHGKTRRVRAPVFGDLVKEDLLGVWRNPEYAGFRRCAMAVTGKPEECRACLFAWGL